jgi:alkyl hydroperoxide reductase subunit AhpC
MSEWQWEMDNGKWTMENDLVHYRLSARANTARYNIKCNDHFSSFSQKESVMLTVGAAFPEFKVKACIDNEKTGFVDITNTTHNGKWVVYIFYPKDFTFLCPTELVEFAKKVKEFKDRDAILIAGSTDNEFSHQAWRKAHPDLNNLPFAMIAAQKLALDLGIIDPNEHVCLRATFIVDPRNMIQWAAAYPLGVGRSVPETLRVLDGIQSEEQCPCNWEKGKATLKA